MRIIPVLIQSVVTFWIQFYCSCWSFWDVWEGEAREYAVAASLVEQLSVVVYLSMVHIYSSVMASL